MHYYQSDHLSSVVPTICLSNYTRFYRQYIQEFIFCSLSSTDNMFRSGLSVIWVTGNLAGWLLRKEVRHVYSPTFYCLHPRTQKQLYQSPSSYPWQNNIDDIHTSRGDLRVGRRMVHRLTMGLLGFAKFSKRLCPIFTGGLFQIF